MVAHERQWLFDEDGVVFFCDRLKRMIVRHDGFKVYPAKIENVIRSVLVSKIAALSAFRT